MTRAASLLGALSVLLFAAPALGGEVAIGAFTGPRGAAVRSQVVKSVCDEVACVPAPTGKKAKKKDAPSVLNGKVAKNKKKVELTLVAAGKPAWKKSYPLAGGKLGAGSLSKIAAQVAKSVGGKAAPPPVAEPRHEPEPAPVAQPTPEPVPSSEPSASTASRPEEDKSDSGGDDWAQADEGGRAEAKAEAPAAGSESQTESASVSATARGGTLPTIFASINMDLLSRGFSYDGLTTANLHEYRGFPIAAPHIHLDAYPLARLTEGWLTGLGLEADLAFTLGLKAIAGPVDFPSQILRFSGALKFRIPLTSSGIAVFPAVGVTYTSFSLSPSANQSTLDGLPEVAYLGLRLGAGLDAPLLDDKLRLGLGVSYVPVFDAGEVISAEYFPEGSVWGIAVNASAGYRILDPLEVRLAFALERYGLQFTSIASDTYRANGASDLLWSLSLGLGVVF